MHKSNMKIFIWDYNNFIESKLIYENKFKIKKILKDKFLKKYNKKKRGNEKKNSFIVHMHPISFSIQVNFFKWMPFSPLISDGWVRNCL